MPTARSASRNTSRAAAAARNQILSELKDDHKRVKKAYREFQKMDSEADPQSCEALVRQVLDELTVHAQLEEELLYPAARGAIADEDLVDEAEVEHESVKTLIEQLREMSPDDEKYAARFTVLCEYVLHHVKEEEGEMFPQLERVRLDWETLSAEMTKRREELMPEEGADLQAEGESGGEMAMAEGQSDDADSPSGAGQTERKTPARKRG